MAQRRQEAYQRLAEIDAYRLRRKGWAIIAIAGRAATTPYIVERWLKETSNPMRSPNIKRGRDHTSIEAVSMLTPIPIPDEQTKAVQEVAKVSCPIVTMAPDFGSDLVNCTIGTISADLTGGEWLHEYRKRKRARLQAGIVKYLEAIDPDRLTEPNLSIVLPLLEAAMDEGREELQDLWARLLANSMIDGGSKVRRDFVATLRSLELVDTRVLELFRISAINVPPQNTDQLLALVAALDDRNVKVLDADMVIVSLQTLQQCKCIGRPRNTNWCLAPYGRQLLAALEVK